MSNIQCKAKRRDNGEWVFGYYCRFGWTGQEKSYIIPACASACTPIEVDPATVCQYTGLTDKDGVKIFEGDIVRAVRQAAKKEQSYNFTVSFENQMFRANRTSGSVSLCTETVLTILEVIGSIHDKEGAHA